MFTLMAIIQKQFALNRKLYVAFIDFEKAFDSIARKLLWLILLQNGIKARLHKCVRSMYENVKAIFVSSKRSSDQNFKKDYPIVDHMFTLMDMIQEQFALNRKLYSLYSF